MSFYGIPPEDLDEVIKLTIRIMDIYEKHNQPIISTDNMLVAMRSMSFMNEPRFDAAIQQYCRDQDGEIILDNIMKFWRLHVYTWCCAQALKRDASLVECGVHLGLYSLVMMKTLNFEGTGREMYLYDTFEGLPDGLSSSRERAQVDGVYDIPDWEHRVRESFSPYANAHVIRGRVPEILSETAPQTVSLLHIDMNAALAEIAALDFFRPRLVPGAIILLDDFGRAEYAELGQAHRDWFGAIDLEILELPTGQGMVIWR